MFNWLMLQGNWDWTEIEGKSETGAKQMRAVLCWDIRVIREILEWSGPFFANLDHSDKASFWWDNLLLTNAFS